MPKKKPKKGNQNSDLPALISEEQKIDIVQNLVKAKSGSKAQEFFLYWVFGVPAPKAAKLAGYSEKSAYGLVHRLKKDTQIRAQCEAFFDEFPERYRMMCKARLPQIAQLEAKALDTYDQKPELFIKHPQIAKQVKQAAGVKLDEDMKPQQPTINVEGIQMYIQNVIEPKPEPKAIEGQVIEDD
jgi:hypothetical protein